MTRVEGDGGSQGANGGDQDGRQSQSVAGDVSAGLTDEASATTAPRVAADADQNADTMGSGLSVTQVIEWTALVIAPTTLVTALAYWIGYELTESRVSHFGLDLGTVGFTTNDYLLRGVVGGIKPVAVLFLMVAGAAGIHTLVGRWHARLNLPLAVAAMIGGVLTVLGIYIWFGPQAYIPSVWYLLPPVLIVVGPLITWYALWQRYRAGKRDTPPHLKIATAAVVALSVVGVFWAMSVYADHLGRDLATNLELRRLPHITIYSERPLGLDPSVVSAGLVPEPGTRYPHRYSGMRLWLHSNGNFFLLPDGWTPKCGRLLVIDDDSDIRIELTPGEGR